MFFSLNQLSQLCNFCWGPILLIYSLKNFLNNIALKFFLAMLNKFLYLIKIHVNNYASFLWTNVIFSKLHSFLSLVTCRYKILIDSFAHFKVAEFLQNSYFKFIPSMFKLISKNFYSWFNFLIENQINFFEIYNKCEILFIQKRTNFSE